MEDSSRPSSWSEEDVRWMQEALAMAKEAYELGEVPVGCVFVRDGQLLARGRNATNLTLNGTQHAEFLAMEQVRAAHAASTVSASGAGPERDATSADEESSRLAREEMGVEEELLAIFAEVTVYVTCEPCIMCASALRHLQVRRVVYGCANDKFGGGGSVFALHADPMRAPGGRRDQLLRPYPCQGGLLREEAVLLLRQFYVRENAFAPVPKKKANRVLKTDDLQLDRP